MGFNIGGLLSGISQSVGQIFGGTTAGQVISAGTGIAAAALTPRGSPPGRATTPPPAPPVRASESAPVNVAQAGPTPAIFRGGGERFAAGFTPARFGRGAGAVAGAAGGAAVEGLSRMFGGSGDNVSEILKEARSNFRGATRNKIIRAAKLCGIEQASDTFGISETDVCKIIVAGPTRRSRGISSAQIRTTKRVIRFNKRLSKDLKSVK